VYGEKLAEKEAPEEEERVTDLLGRRRIWK
jgi:hypothetical protein